MSVDLVLIGDSIRMGYQSRARECLDSIDIWSPEANGGDSANILGHLDEWVDTHTPYLVHLNCGLHDLKKPFDSGLAQVGLAAYRHNVEQIFERILRSGAQLVWANTTPVDEDLHHRNKGFDRFGADIDAYNAAAAEVAVAHDVPVNDLHAVIEQVGRSRLLREDGVHFSEEGSRLLGEAVAAFVSPLLKRR